MPTRNYDLDFGRLVRDVLPAVLRRPRMLGYCAALVSPVKRLHRAFLQLRRSVLDELPIGPEVRVLRHYLNRRYDYALGRIQLLDGQEADPLRIYTAAEDQPIYLPVYLSAQRIDFTVVLPADLFGFEDAIRAFLDRYKLPTKTYRIIYA